MKECLAELEEAESTVNDLDDTLSELEGAVETLAKNLWLNFILLFIFNNYFPMGFSVYCILEAMLLCANAVAILNERFLKQMGFHIDNINNNEGN